MTPERLTVSAERIPHSGAWVLATIIGGQYRHAVTYYDMTKREALRAFRAACQDLAGYLPNRRQWRD